jgi:hypothetical protein
METKIKTASVKIMLSYDYSHFETSMLIENDFGLALSDIDEARKKCQRLVDKAVGQYKIAKDFASKRTDGKYLAENYERQCLKIKEKNENDRTLNEIAMLKQYEDENWKTQFDFNYDYDDDIEYKL